MNRKLKFRAWDSLEKKWLHGYETIGGFSLVGETVLLGEFLSGISIDRLNDIRIDQLTGLQDSDGNNIYEGDIVRSYHFVDNRKKKHYLFHVVGWSEKWAGWHFYSRPDYANGGDVETPDGSVTALVYQRYSPEAKVVGNIHENPELLQTA